MGRALERICDIEVIPTKKGFKAKVTVRFKEDFDFTTPEKETKELAFKAALHGLKHIFLN